ncbi:MAG TPA: DinB family protein [Pirellulaceae bacterium]|mgnify:CR=1 FL=1|nr:DinB family protein [Planctomycetales bacterium]HRX78147.1 DinB family protein [Pirellulaceae bacterium]
MLISALMTAELPGELSMTRKLLTRIPDDKLDWKPPGELHSIAWNANHLVEIIGWVPGIVRQNEWDIAPVGGEPYVPPAVTQTSQLLDAFDVHSKTALDVLHGIPDSVMDEPWSLKMGGQTLFTMNKGDCIRKWVFGHSAHHRGILSAYLRMAGLQFPSIYEE